MHLARTAVATAAVIADALALTACGLGHPFARIKRFAAVPAVRRSPRCSWKLRDVSCLCDMLSGEIGSVQCGVMVLCGTERGRGSGLDMRRPCDRRGGGPVEPPLAFTFTHVRRSKGA